MRFDPEKHHRRSIRLKGYDYRRQGAYFVTICTHDRLCLFGEVVGGEMRLNEYGRIALGCWKEIPLHFPQAELDAFVVMPNHVHGIIVLTVGARHAVPYKTAFPKKRNNLVNRLQGLFPRLSVHSNPLPPDTSMPCVARPGHPFGNAITTNT
jgi:REP element-mobilizing transposase RayT